MEPKIDPIVELFEKKVCEFTGAPYGVAVSSNTNGIFLVLEALKHFGDIEQETEITIPKRTYYSVGMSILNAGFRVGFRDEEWYGEYALEPTVIFDSATYLAKNMYKPGSIRVISTQYRKGIPIGRGGVILLGNFEYAEHLRLMRMNGNEYVRGWNMYMTPEQAARGLSLMEKMKEPGIIASYSDYPDISDWGVWG